MKIKVLIISLTLLLSLIILHYSGFYNMSYIRIGEIPTIIVIVLLTATIVFYEHYINIK